MNRVCKVVSLILCLAMCCCVFAGCQSDQSLAKVEKNGKLVMLTSSGFEPFEYLGDDNQVAGVDVDIAQLIADELGVELEVVDMDFDGIIPALMSGKGDIGVAGMSITEERKASVDFSVEYLQSTQAILVRADDDRIQSPEDLAGMVIGVQQGTTGDLFASDDDSLKEVKRYKKGLEASLDLAAGRLDAIIWDQMPCEQTAAENDALKVLDTPFAEEFYAIAVNKGAEALLTEVNKVLDKLVADGTVDALIEQHMTDLRGE